MFTALFGDYYPCHCADDEACNPVTGACPSGCDDDNYDGQVELWKGDWGGPACQIGKLMCMIHVSTLVIRYKSVYSVLIVIFTGY